MTEHNSTQSQFPAQLRIVTQAAAFLAKDCAGTNVAERTGPECAAAMKHVQDRLALLRAERPERICVLVLGEFKAGKSTLINALIGRAVAAVDVFEMTTAVCRVVPSSVHTEGAVLRGKNAMVPPLRLSLSEFLARSQARSLGGYTQVDLHVQSDLDLVLIDTPGLGATLENEINALDALATTDVVLWTLDADSLGGAREAAAITRIRQDRLPLICALTKADVLEEEQVEEAVGYIAGEFALPPASIFPVSATRALENRGEAGVERLRRHLIERVAPRGAILREQALLANAADIAAELSEVLDRSRRSLESAVEQLNEYNNAMKMTAQIVTEDVCSEMNSRIQEALVKEINERIDVRLGESADGRPLSEADLAAVLQESTKKIDGRQFWDALSQSVEKRIQAEWAEGIRGQITSLLETLTEVRRDADRDAARIAEELLNVQLVEARRKQSSVTYGLETATAAVIGTVLSGGNVFIGMLAAAPMMYQWWQASSEGQQAPSSYERRLFLQKNIIDWVNDTVCRKVNDNLYPSLLKLNNQVAEKACIAYAEKQEQWPIPLLELTELLAQCEDARSSLAEVRKGRMPALTTVDM